MFRGCGEAPFDDDLTARLLIVWRRVLIRRKPKIADDAARYIDAHLLRLARNPERMKSDLHWDFWGRAVSALQLKRMSDELQSYARRLQEAAAAKKLEPPRAKAARHLSFPAR